MTQARSFSGRKLSILEKGGAWAARISLPDKLRSFLKAAFHRLLMARSRGVGILCNLPLGESVQILPEFRYLTWNLEEYESFRDSVKPGMVALDIGANVGAYSLLLGQWAGPNGRVFAFEPDPEVCEALRRHIKLNQLDQQVKVSETAASDKVGVSSFTRSKEAGFGRIGAGDSVSDRLISVSTTTIDAFCERENIRPQFIKIDVEGLELAVLQGARETIRRCAGALGLFVELHPGMWREVGVTKEEFLAELSVQDLAIEPLVPGISIWETEGLCVRLISQSHAHTIRK